MSNVLGNILKIIAFGESHGKAVGCVIDGCPAGLMVNYDRLQFDLDIRKPGTSSFVSQRGEQDKFIILSGLFNGYTTGTPITIIVNNLDKIGLDYSNLAFTFRPGHADITYYYKYGIRDFYGGGRSSARTTISLVIAGSLCRVFISDFFRIRVFAYLSSIGNISIPFVSKSFCTVSNLFIPNKSIIIGVFKYLNTVRIKCTSIGASIVLVISGLICGLGDPLFSKINSELTRSLMFLNAVKSVDIGIGKYGSFIDGINNNDSIIDTGFLSNNSGGILGGITTGQDIRARVYIKPTSSISVSQSTIDYDYNVKNLIVKGRHDPCVGIRAVPIVEAIASTVIFDLILSQRVIRFF